MTEGAGGRTCEGGDGGKVLRGKARIGKGSQLVGGVGHAMVVVLEKCGEDMKGF